jgi:hypothetical protein
MNSKGMAWPSTARAKKRLAMIGGAMAKDCSDRKSGGMAGIGEAVNSSG